jgi:hypothetical protein
MTRFKVTTVTGEETEVEADLYKDSENGQWVDFIRKGKGTGYNDPEQVLRLRSQNIAVIERLEQE